MKCATSTLHEQLAMQDSIFMSSPKEPNFFSDDRNWKKGLEWYTNLFTDEASGDLCGESSTHYTKLPTYPKTVERINRYLPHVKMIYVMRHPVDRLISHYIHEWTERKIDVPIDAAIDEHPELVAYSQYAMQLEPYLETFGCQQILPVFFERMISKAQTEIERICHFIGYADQPTYYTTEAENVSSQRMRKNTFRDALAWNPVMNRVRPFIPQSFRERVKSFWRMTERPVIGIEKRALLTDIFDHDLSKLSDMLNIDLSCSTFKEQVLSHLPAWREI